MKSAPRRRLFWRLYLSGLGLLVAVMVTTGFIVRHTMAEPHFNEVAARIFHHLFRPLPAELNEDFALPPGGRGGPRGRRMALLGDPAHMQARLDEIAEVLGGEMAVYERDGTRLAAQGDEPPPPLGPEEARDLRRWDFTMGQEVLVAVPVFPGPRAPYLRWRVPDHRPHPQPLIFLGVALLATAIVFYPVARSLAGPIERVAATARRLGEGDLEARTGIVRKDEIGLLARNLDEAAERIARLLRSEKEMLANVSHELRTPLARLSVALELCDEEEGREALRRHLSGMGEDIGELDRLVGDILMAARLELAKDGRQEIGFVLRPEPLDAAALLEGAALRLRERHPEARLQTRSAPALSFVADPALLRRVLDNLLDNAVKYARPGEAPEIELAVRAEETVLRFEVQDRGVGVPEADLPRLFEAFFRSDRSRSGHIPGTGLGLTLCQRIVEAHGGQIAANARQGGGLVVTFILPGDQVSASRG